MIKVSRINGKDFYLNPDLVEFVEETPDTVITMTTGKKIIIEETADLLIDRIIEYKQRIFLGLPQRIKGSDYEKFEG